jgi:hypothetical protein
LSGVDYVYLWADGIHVNVRLEEHKLCLLVLIGVRADGRKELVALADGYRESTESWADLLRDAARRGMSAPVLAVGDGALGFWGALREVFPATREQRCWFHKIANVLGALPKSAHPGAKKALAEIWNAEDRRHALDAVAAFTAAYGAKFGKAVAKITDDLDELLAFYDFPAEHWIHLRTTDEIVNPLLGRAGFVVVGAVFVRSPRQSKIAGPEPGSRWSARSAARTNDLDRGEDRRSVRRRWTWSDPVAKCRVWGCQPCRAASPREGLESRAPVVAATSTPDLSAPFLRAAVRAAGRVGCHEATIVR